MVQKRIQKELGIKYEVVYDAFYSPDERITQIQSIVKECALEYYNNYVTNNCYIKKPTTTQDSTNISSVNSTTTSNSINKETDSSEKTDMYIVTKTQNSTNNTIIDYDETMKRFYEQNNLKQKDVKRVTTMDNILI